MTKGVCNLVALSSYVSLSSSFNKTVYEVHFVMERYHISNEIRSKLDSNFFSPHPGHVVICLKINFWLLRSCENLCTVFKKKTYFYRSITIYFYCSTYIDCVMKCQTFSILSLIKILLVNVRTRLVMQF